MVLVCSVKVGLGSGSIWGPKAETSSKLWVASGGGLGPVWAVRSSEVGEGGGGKEWGGEAGWREFGKAEVELSRSQQLRICLALEKSSWIARNLTAETLLKLC